MSEDNLLSDLLSLPVPAKPQKKEASSDILNSLYSLDIPPPKKKENEVKKSRHQDEINQYISSVNKNKAAAPSSKPKQQYANTIEPVVKKPNSSSHHAKTNTPKPAQRVHENKQTKYMPTVVDIFAKKQDKSCKTKQIAQKTESSKVRLVEEKSKVQAKKDKIQRKQIQKSNKPMQDKPTLKPESIEKQKRQQKQYSKQQLVQKQRPQKKKKESSSSSSESSSSSSSQSDSQDWRKELRNITGYNPGDKKFRERDHMVIKQSGVDRIFGEDKFSFRMGRRQQEEDMRLQQLRRLKKLKKKQHRDRP